MSRVGLLAVAVLLLGSLPAHAGVVKVMHSSWKGGGANTYFWLGDGSAGVDVWESSTGVNLYYHKSAPDLTSQVCQTETYPGKDGTPVTVTWCYYTRWTYENGWGTVPSADFLIKQGTARLNTTVATGPSFFVETCVSDQVAGTWTCNPTGGGVINVTWAKDGISSSATNGTSQYTYGNYTFKTAGHYSSYSAVATGSIVGQSCVDAYGWVSKTVGVHLTREVLKTTP